MSPRSTSTRIANLDAARGAAMLLVCLSHFTQVYLGTPSGATADQLSTLYALGMIASPTFVVVSGTILGLLFVVKRETFADLRLKLIDRAIFLLTVAHVLIACSRLTYQTHAMDALRMTFMTDTIGICVIAGVFLVDRTSRLARCVIGLICFGLAWRLLYIWTPDDTLVQLAKEVLIGSTPNRVLGYTVPVLPWFGVYIASTALGEYIGDLYRRNNVARVERTLLIAGCSTVALALAVRCVGWAVTGRGFGDPKVAAYWSMFFSPWSKLPPGPEYALFFGGLGMLLIWGVTFAGHRSYFSRVLAHLAVLGRCSLAVFTIQFYVFYMFLGALHLHATPFWPLVFGACVGVILAFAHWWDRHDLNVVLTVGTPRVVQIWRARHLPRVATRPQG